MLLSVIGGEDSEPGSRSKESNHCRPIYSDCSRPLGQSVRHRESDSQLDRTRYQLEEGETYCTFFGQGEAAAQPAALPAVPPAVKPRKRPAAAEPITAEEQAARPLKRPAAAPEALPPPGPTPESAPGGEAPATAAAAAGPACSANLPRRGDPLFPACGAQCGVWRRKNGGPARCADPKVRESS